MANSTRKDAKKQLLDFFGAHYTIEGLMEKLPDTAVLELTRYAEGLGEKGHDLRIAASQHKALRGI